MKHSKLKLVNDKVFLRNIHDSLAASLVKGDASKQGTPLKFKSRLLAKVTYDIVGSQKSTTDESIDNKSIQTWDVVNEEGKVVGSARDGEPVENSEEDVVDVVQFRFQSNWGDEEKTCIYRVRVHGE